MSLFDYINSATIEEFNKSGGGIYQVMTFKYPFSGIEPLLNMRIYYTDCCYYDLDHLDGTDISFAYSTDSVCWSCYMNKETIIQNIAGLSGDYYLRIRANNIALIRK